MGETELTDIFDESSDGLACRVCGSLVARDEPFRSAHVDWHEATNGA